MQNAPQPITRNTKQGGFTLIELLIVIAIIGILTSVGVPQYQRYVERAEFTAEFSEMNSYRTLIDAELASGNNGTLSEVASEIDLPTAVNVATGNPVAITTYSPNAADDANQAVLTSTNFTYSRSDDEWVCEERANTDAATAADSQLPQACR